MTARLPGSFSMNDGGTLTKITSTIIGTLYSLKSSHSLKSKSGKVLVDNHTVHTHRSKSRGIDYIDKDDRVLTLDDLQNGATLIGSGSTFVDNGVDGKTDHIPRVTTAVTSNTRDGSFMGSFKLLPKRIGFNHTNSRRNLREVSLSASELVDNDVNDEAAMTGEEDSNESPDGSRTKRRRHTVIGGEEQDELSYFSQRTSTFDFKLDFQYVMHPHGRTRMVWDVLQVLFLTWILVTTPFELAFMKDMARPTHRIVIQVDYVLDWMFVIDIVFNFMTAVEYDGKLSFTFHSIIRHYLRGWFFFDLLWTIPFYAMTGEKDADMLHIALIDPSLYALCRGFRALRVMSLLRIRGRLEYSLRVPSSSSSLFGFAYTVLGLAHVFSCIFAFLAFGDEEHLRIAVEDDLLQDATLKTKYIAAFYWSMMTITTVGYGDLTVKTNLGRLFSIMAMTAGGGIFAYGISNVVDLFAQLYVEETQYRHKMDQVNTFMHVRDLPRKFRDEIRANFFHLRKASRENKVHDRAIVQQMSRAMQSRVAELFCCEMMPRKLPSLVGCNAEFIHEMYLSMEVKCYLPGENIIRQDEYGTELYILFVGHVQVFVGHTKVAVFGPTTCFGEFAIMNPKKPRLATIQAVNFCETHCLDRETLLRLVIAHPFVLQSIKQLVHLKSRKAGSMLFDSAVKTRTLLQGLAALWHHDGIQGLLPYGVTLENTPHLQQFNTVVVQAPPPLISAARSSVRTGLGTNNGLSTARRKSLTSVGLEMGIGDLNNTATATAELKVVRRRSSAAEEVKSSPVVPLSNEKIHHTNSDESSAPVLNTRIVRYVPPTSTESTHTEAPQLNSDSRDRRNSVGSLMNTEMGDNRVVDLLNRMNEMLRRQETLEHQVRELLAAQKQTNRLNHQLLDDIQQI